jgi:hypothetical protein
VVAGGSARGAANRPYRAVYRAPAAVFTAGGGADDELGGGPGRERRGRGPGKASESRETPQPRLLGHPGVLGFMGLNGPAHVFSFSFFQLLKLQINTKCTQI